MPSHNVYESISYFLYQFLITYKLTPKSLPYLSDFCFSYNHYLKWILHSFYMLIVSEVLFTTQGARWFLVSSWLRTPTNIWKYFYINILNFIVVGKVERLFLYLNIYISGSRFLILGTDVKTFQCKVSAHMFLKLSSSSQSYDLLY